MTIIDDTEHSRFAMEIDGALAKLDYRRHANRLVLVHTEVPEQLGGQGLGGQLVRFAVDTAARDGLVVVPSCSYAHKWLVDHPEVAATVDIDWPEATS